MCSIYVNYFFLSCVNVTKLDRQKVKNQLKALLRLKPFVLLVAFGFGRSQRSRRFNKDTTGLLAWAESLRVCWWCQFSFRMHLPASSEWLEAMHVCRTFSFCLCSTALCWLTSSIFDIFFFFQKRCAFNFIILEKKVSIDRALEQDA